MARQPTAPARARAPHRPAADPAVADAARAFLLSRAVVWIAGVVAVLAIGVRDENARAYDPGGLTRPFGELGDALLAPGARWDAVWFVSIATDGYEPDPARSAFFPLYPLLVRVVGFVTGPDVVAAILISLACLFGALVLLHRLVAIDFGRDAARLCVLLVAVAPVSVWLSSAYSESLFLLLSAGAVYAARTDRWAWAGVASALAATTRSAGVVLLVPLALLWWRSSGRRLADLAWTALVPAGLAAVCAVAALAGHGFLAPFHAQEVWMRDFAGPFGAVPDGIEAGWEGLRGILAGTERPDRPFDPYVLDAMLLATLVFVVVAAIGALRRLPAAYGLYCVAALALPLSYPVPAQPLMSLPRFASVLWPLYLWLALVLLRAPTPVRRGVIALSLAGLALVSGHVARWEWVA